MMQFDGSAREVCNARRIRTNTPLQALTVLNDSAYLDLARQLAYHVQGEQGNNYREAIAQAYALAAGIPVTPKKLDLLWGLYQTALQRFSGNRKLAAEMAGKDGGKTLPETAALVTVANAVLNLDEVITKY
jgi:Ser/Thr protein kinase RdoA (MazF antagonist)